MMRPCSLLLLVATAAVAIAAPVVTANLGGWGVIPNVNDAHVQEVGAWAVAEHGKRANDGLRFGRVVSGEDEKVASGVNYRLGIVAVNLAGQNVTCHAVVYEESSSNTRQLLAFDRAH